MSHQTSHLGVLVIRPEVEMQSALNLLALIKPDEVQPRQAIRLRADLELLIRGVDHNPTKSRSPPLPQGHRIYRVNNYLFPFQGHPPSLDLPGLQEQAVVPSRPRSRILIGYTGPPARPRHVAVRLPDGRTALSGTGRADRCADRGGRKSGNASPGRGVSSPHGSMREHARSSALATGGPAQLPGAGARMVPWVHGPFGSLQLSCSASPTMMPSGPRT